MSGRAEAAALAEVPVIVGAGAPPPERVQWVENNDAGLRGRIARAHLINAGPLAGILVGSLLLGVAGDLFVGLALLCVLLVGSTATSIDARTARATAVTPEELLIRVRRGVRSYRLNQLKEVSYGWSRDAGKCLHVLPSSEKKVDYYGLTPGRSLELAREVERAKQALASLPVARANTGPDPGRPLPALKMGRAGAWAVSTLENGDEVADTVPTPSVGGEPPPAKGVWISVPQWNSLVSQTAAFVITTGLLASPFVYVGLQAAGFAVDWRQACMVSLVVGSVAAAAVGRRFFIGQHAQSHLRLPDGFGPQAAVEALVRRAAGRSGRRLESQEGSGASSKWTFDAGIKVWCLGQPGAPGAGLVVEVRGRANKLANARFKGEVLDALRGAPQGDPTAAGATARSAEIPAAAASVATSDTEGAA